MIEAARVPEFWFAVAALLAATDIALWAYYARGKSA